MQHVIDQPNSEKAFHPLPEIQTPTSDPTRTPLPADPLAGVWEALRSQAKSLATDWTLYQVLIIAASFGVAVLLARMFTPRLEARLRRIEGRPRLLRFLVIPLRRLQWILFALILWVISTVMQQYTWPSRSFFVVLAANLAMAWVAISFAARVIRKRQIARIFAVTAWTVVAFQTLGLLGPVLAILDNLAFGLGSFRLSLLMVLKGAVLLALLLWLANLTSDFLDRRIRENLDLGPSLQVLITKILRAGMLTLAVVVTLSAIGLDLTALTIFSGAFGLGLGFGLQRVASNLMSGIIILLDRSIKPGDVISLGETFGWISSLRGRYVSVVTRDGVEYLIPNEDLVTKEVVNWSHSDRNIRLEVRFGVSYDSDPHMVRDLTCRSAARIKRVLTRPGPVCHLVAFGDSSIDFVLRFWIADPENGLTNVRGQVFLALWDVFKENGIDIPFPHREVIMRPAAVATGLAATGDPVASKKPARRRQSRKPAKPPNAAKPATGKREDPAAE